MEKQIRPLNKKGREDYLRWVLSLKDNPNQQIPYELLSDSETSITLSGTIKYPDISPQTKNELVKGILPVVKQLEGLNIDSDVWPGIYDALALKYFHFICRLTKDGNGYNPLNHAHYCRSKEYNRYYRHLIFGPLKMFRNAGQFIEPFFNMSPRVFGDLAEGMGAYQELAENPGVFEVIYRIYSDGNEPKVGINNKPETKAGAGCLRRLIPVIRQLDRNYDFAEMKADQILSLLPPEFDRWKVA